MKSAWRVCGLLACVIPVQSACSSFGFERDTDAGTITIFDREMPVLTWRYGDQLPHGVPIGRKRSSRIAPFHRKHPPFNGRPTGQGPQTARPNWDRR